MTQIIVGGVSAVREVDEVSRDNGEAAGGDCIMTD